MPQVTRPIATVADLAVRSRTAAQHTIRLLELPDLPFGGIDPGHLMAEFNELHGAATRLFGGDQLRDFRPYNLAISDRYWKGQPAYRQQALRQAANALTQLTMHVQRLADSPPDDVVEMPGSAGLHSQTS